MADRLLPRITVSGAPAWIAPHPDETEPNPPQGYVVSFVHLHERGFGVPVSRFMRALCDYYGAELHNFSPNAISQAAVFVAVCEGYLGILAHWDLWRHLFRGGLYTDSVTSGVRRHVHAGGLMLHLRESRKDLYIPCTMTSNNCDWDKVWFYLRNDDGWLPANTGKILTERPYSWGYGVSPPSARPSSRCTPTRCIIWLARG